MTPDMRAASISCASTRGPEALDHDACLVDVVAVAWVISRWVTVRSLDVGRVDQRRDRPAGSR